MCIRDRFKTVNRGHGPMRDASLARVGMCTQMENARTHPHADGEHTYARTCFLERAAPVRA
eukprot:7002375-Alexandrium_andersonii.AAC.1